jgi:hypothetical protein
MRRALALVALSGALLAAAACGSNGDTPAAVATTKADYTANTKEVCTALATALAAQPTEAQVTAAVTEAVKGKTGAEANAAALAAVKKILTDWFAPVAVEAAKAEDPQLKTALTDLGTGAAAAIGEIKSMDTIQADMTAAEAKLTALEQKVDTSCSAVGVKLPE